MRKSIYRLWKLPVSLLGSAVFAAGLCLPASANQPVQVFKTEKAKVSVTRFASGIDTPWSMAMLPDGSLLVTERGGRLLLISKDNPSHLQPVVNVPEVWAQGQGGLLDVVLDADFEKNRTIYLTFSEPDASGNAGTALARARLETVGTPRLSDFTVLYSMDRKTGRGQHFGSRIVPDGKGSLWFTIGDRGQADRAQDPFDPAGSVMRIGVDGSIPSDNPFANGRKALPTVWSIGHRNPQGATLDDRTGKLWTLSHGARGGDEINIPQAGKNYGWPVISYGVHYSGRKIGIGTAAPGFEQPIYYWDPSIAPSGMDFYQGDLVPQWKGNLFIGALKYRMLVRLEVEGERIVSQEPLFADEFGRIRDVRYFPDGALWFLTDDDDGAIYRINSAD